MIIEKSQFILTIAIYILFSFFVSIQTKPIMNMIGHNRLFTSWSFIIVNLEILLVKSQWMFKSKRQSIQQMFFPKLEKIFSHNFQKYYIFTSLATIEKIMNDTRKMMLFAKIFHTFNWVVTIFLFIISLIYLNKQILTLFDQIWISKI